MNEVLRSSVTKNYRHANNLEEGDAAPDPYIGLLNASKDEAFIVSCIDIVTSLTLRETVVL